MNGVNALMTHSTHSIYSYITMDIWLRTTQIKRQETNCLHVEQWLDCDYNKTLTEEGNKSSGQ